ncbi:quinone-dependent dihydroorotate dehydrogenase [Candidatus Peregrinibacteria bacterium]|nr:quinone-dependent dihydroorotate dehydrogenase [Candidatus Peregrinibacteria bacterium]
MRILRKIVAILYKYALKPVLFLFDPEKVHELFLWVGEKLGSYKWAKTFTRKLFRYDNKILRIEIDGIKLKNPIGLSAGFDKDANLQNILYEVGFGYMQIGSVTAKPYGGNQGPRLHRLKKSRGIVVNYGLKNLGVNKIIEKLEGYKNLRFPVSISIARSNHPDTSSIESAIEDYFYSFEKLYENNIGDFYTLNISCPNVKDRDLFYKTGFLEKLLEKISELGIQKPIFVKMPPLEWNKLKGLLEVIIKYELKGIILSNLEKDKERLNLRDKVPGHVSGGISGKPIEKLTNELIKKTYKEYGEKLVIIGCGGVFSAADAYTKIKSGASLVQLITGMIYEGPQLIGQINHGLKKLLKRDGYKHVSEAVGVDVK